MVILLRDSSRENLKKATSHAPIGANWLLLLGDETAQKILFPLGTPFVHPVLTVFFLKFKNDFWNFFDSTRTNSRTQYLFYSASSGQLLETPWRHSTIIHQGYIRKTIFCSEWHVKQVDKDVTPTKSKSFFENWVNIFDIQLFVYSITTNIYKLQNLFSFLGWKGLTNSSSCCCWCCNCLSKKFVGCLPSAWVMQ